MERPGRLAPGPRQARRSRSPVVRAALPVPRGGAEGDRPDPRHDRDRRDRGGRRGRGRQPGELRAASGGARLPPATLAGGDFTAAANGRGITMVLSGWPATAPRSWPWGQSRGPDARAQFFVSTDGGRSWAVGAVRAPGGGPPPPGYAASFVAAGPQGGLPSAPGPSRPAPTAEPERWPGPPSCRTPRRPDEVCGERRLASSPPDPACRAATG